MQFLQMVAAVFVAFIVLVVVGYFWIRWKLRGLTEKWTDGMEKMLKHMQSAGAGLLYVPPMTIELTPAGDDDITNKQDFEFATMEVQNLGFHRGGLFRLGEIGAICRALFHPDRKLDAVVCEHPLIGVWVEFCAQFPDGTSMTYLNSKQTSGLDHPPGRDNRNFPDEQVANVWERFRRALIDRSLPNVTADSFQQRYEEAYDREMEWRMERGGVTEDEVRRCVEMAGGEFSEDHCRMVQQTWRMRIAQFKDEQLREAFAEGSKMSIAEYERKRDRLVFIHDQTAASQLLMHLKYSDDDDEQEDIENDDPEDADFGDPRLTKMEQRCLTSSPREVFRQMRDAGELQGEYEFVQEMTKPYPADVYASRSS